MKKWKLWQWILMLNVAVIALIIILKFNPLAEKHKSNRIERKCFKKIESYINSYDEYLLMKYDGKDPIYHSDVINIDWVYIKNNRPDLYNNYIEPIKIKWDSIKYIPVEKTLLEGVPENVLKYKLKYKEIDKAKTKIKVKKSDGVDISNYQNTTVVKDTIN